MMSELLPLDSAALPPDRSAVTWWRRRRPPGAAGAAGVGHGTAAGIFAAAPPINSAVILRGPERSEGPLGMIQKYASRQLRCGAWFKALERDAASRRRGLLKLGIASMVGEDHLRSARLERRDGQSPIRPKARARRNPRQPTRFAPGHVAARGD
jgi:hypothetical protein